MLFRRGGARWTDSGTGPVTSKYMLGLVELDVV